MFSPSFLFLGSYFNASKLMPCGPTSHDLSRVLKQSGRLGTPVMDIPIELILHIFGHLSPPDVLSLAATCRKHYNALQQNTNTIYNFISRTIQCEPDARGLLADQGILPVDSAMTVTGFLQLRRNAHVMEKIVERFGREFVIPFCCPFGMCLLH